MKFTVNRYVVISTEIEADTAEQALELEIGDDQIISINTDLLSTWEWSTNPAWVTTDDGETVLEEGYN
jgi:hypothetical protein